jgi:3',5'-cyclic-AMP phosphodiesterase
MIIAQLSDPHISDANPEHEVALERAVQHLNRFPAHIDAVLITGDCTDHGTSLEYQRCLETLRALTVPFYVIPGNHDNRTGMLNTFGLQGRNAIPGFIQYVVNLGPLRLVALDTHVPGNDEGFLGIDRLSWLDDQLGDAPDLPTLVFMHHPPFPTGFGVFDAIGLRDASEFGAIVARHTQIERILAGHAHWSMVRRFHGTVAMTCPATTASLIPDFRRLAQLAIVSQTPACLIHVWSEDTGFVTYTSQIRGELEPELIHDGTRWLP